MLRRYFESIVAIDDDMSYRCLVNLLMNMSFVSMLPDEEQISLIEFMIGHVSPSGNTSTVQVSDFMKLTDKLSIEANPSAGTGGVKSAAAATSSA